jgi:hypothetical protein
LVTGTEVAEKFPLALVEIAAKADAPAGVMTTLALPRPPPKLLVTAPLIAAYCVGVVTDWPPGHAMQARRNGMSRNGSERTIS